MDSSIIFSIIATIICGLVLWEVKRYFNKMDKRDEEHEKSKAKFNTLLLKGTIASISFGEATADAMKNGRCNGKMKAAEDQAVEVKKEIKEFMYEQGVENIV